MALSRRMLLGAAVSTIALRAWGEAPLTSLRPRARVPAKDAISAMVAGAGIAGAVGVMVTDLATGEVLEDINSAMQLPPASVTKAVTALYALETLGPTHRFTTKVIAAGLVTDGILQGDLILAGGGDPNLVTDDVAALAQSLKDSGLREVRGDFLVWDGALTNLDEIDAGQLDHVGYNPTITGLNLNFNRVHFEWKAVGDAFETAMDARSENYRPTVTTSRISVVDRPAPLFTYRAAGDVDQWTVAKGALNNAGSRWLPVRNPALYTGQVFASFARSHGIVLKPPQEVQSLPQGETLARHNSPDLTRMMQSMLRFSTNITAEAAGLAATARRADGQRGLRTSALGMARWAEGRAGGIAPVFVDHSGLGDESRISAADMVQLLEAENVAQQLRPIMKTIALIGDDGVAINDPRIAVRAKTGTLNFVSTLAGYVRTHQGRELAFAIFAADLEARERGKRQGDEVPRGAVGWNRRVRALQQGILKHLTQRLV